MSREEVNRIIAEKVMGWHRENVLPIAWYNNDRVIVWFDCAWKPSENPAQFTEAFAKAGMGVQDDAISRVLDTVGTTGANIESVRMWQLAPIEIKAKCLVEALFANEE